VIRVALASLPAHLRAELEASLRGREDLETTEELGIAAGDLAADVVVAEAGSRGAEQVAEKAPGAALVLLSRATDPQATVGALRAGASSLLPASATPAQILAAIEAAAAGLITMSPEDLEGLLSPEPRFSGAHTLTTRETEVLTLLAEGVSNKEIAYRLGISEHTAKFHVASILAKLDAGTRTEAVTEGIRRGLVFV
jgi:DNA-binding NarL/FixJ family response regulator